MLATVVSAMNVAMSFESLTRDSMRSELKTDFQSALQFSHQSAVKWTTAI